MFGLRVRELVRQVCEHLKIEMLRGVVSKDYIHLLVSAPPTTSVSEVMRWVKGRSSTKKLQEFPVLKKRYWGKHFWAKGYCVDAVGLDADMVRKYVKHQEKLERQQELDL